MSYKTILKGSFKIEPKLDKFQLKYINSFSNIRHVKRNPENIKSNEKYALRKSVGFLEPGKECEFCICKKDFRDPSVIDFNNPPETQPGLYCRWIVNNDGNYLKWNECDNFYNYTAWLQYMIDNFFKKWGRVLNGIILYIGEDLEDYGFLVVKNNEIQKYVDFLNINKDKESICSINFVDGLIIINKFDY